MNKAKTIIALANQRNKLMAEYAAHRRVRAKLECDLDRLTCRIARLTGLEPASYAAGGWLDPLKGERVLQTVKRKR
jgi:hypothetical protein